MKEIGGYFELELNRGSSYHSMASQLNFARNCLFLIVSQRKYDRVYVPYYTCDIVITAIEKARSKVSFYEIDECLNPVTQVSLKRNEGYLYTNYFGLKTDTVIQLSSIYGNQLIIDNAQAFFALPLENIDTFYSARKYFGTTDGAYLYSSVALLKTIGRDYSYDRMAHLLKRIDLSAEDGYNDFKKSEEKARVIEPRVISKLSERILDGIDYNNVKTRRIENYNYLDTVLNDYLPHGISLDNASVPMVYPYYCKKEGIREWLIANKIYVATYWDNVLKQRGPGTVEFELTKKLIPLPIDQRYDTKDMEYIISIINSFSD